MSPVTVPNLLVHGGAGEWANRNFDAVLRGMHAAAAAGWDVLRGGGTALDAVERAVIVLEDDPLFDAGLGSFVNDQGEVEMDALIADGVTVNFGAVAAVKRVKNPISLARLVLEKTDNCFFVAEGADNLAATFGLPLVSNIELITPDEFAHFHARSRHDPARRGLGTGTVGAVAVDTAGHLASATSTGGVPDKRKGRVGDTPVFGAGGYADNVLGAASATGKGEDIMRFFLCQQSVAYLASSADAHEAAGRALAYLAERVPSPDAGVIVISRDGGIGAGHTTAAMPVAWIGEGGEIKTSLRVAGRLI